MKDALSLKGFMNVVTLDKVIKVTSRLLIKITLILRNRNMGSSQGLMFSGGTDNPITFCCHSDFGGLSASWIMRYLITLYAQNVWII